MKADAIINAVEGVTKKWAQQRKREEREASAFRNRRIAMMRPREVTIREAAWAVMKQAYMKASAGGKLPAHARQIMYAARPEIQAISDKELGGKFDQYFTQRLLPDYIEEKASIGTWSLTRVATSPSPTPKNKSRSEPCRCGNT
jgi:hypothetical protein